MLTPGPDHPITIEPANRRWRAYFAGHVIADTNDALIMQEANLGPVVYFPRNDVSLEYFTRTDHVTHCPYKGDAGHYSLYMDGELVEKAAWTYEAPYDAVGEINGRIAFYPEIEVYAVDDAAVNPHHDADAAKEDRSYMDRREVDEIVQHTDAGDGTTQREHWEPNVEGPGPDGGLR
ncbi:DUF427 domain-containing protein [Phenylobacterium sp. VNQ135]|uniref:DUF427 domain-containing protein n=1 Tax=Phenylobacterium sp. VNQ135 TaxID=3400922 RepID=UPI003C0550EB